MTDELKAPSEDESRQTYLPSKSQRCEVEQRENDERDQGAAHIDSGVVKEDGDRGRNRKIDWTNVHQVHEPKNPQQNQRNSKRMTDPIATVRVIRRVFDEELVLGHVLVPIDLPESATRPEILPAVSTGT